MTTINGDGEAYGSDEEQPDAMVALQALKPPQQRLRPHLSRSDVAKYQSVSPMLVAAYKIVDEPRDGQPEGELKEVSLEEAIDGQQQQQKPFDSDKPQPQPEQFWIDVEIKGPIGTALPMLHETVLDHLYLGLKGEKFLRKMLLQQQQLQTPQVLALRDAALIVVRILDVAQGKVRHAAALCLRHTVVTITSSSNRIDDAASCSQLQVQGETGAQQVPKQDKKLSVQTLLQNDTLSHMLERELPEPTVSGCVLLWLGFHVSRTAQLAHELREELYALAERASQNIEELNWYEISRCRDGLLRFGAVAEEQNECVEAVAEGDAVSEGLNFDSTLTLKGSLNVVKHMAASTERLCRRMEKRLEDIEKAYDANQQNRINHRLNVLTIISAIFLPLTLIAGIYGQNFVNIPGLEYKNAYFIELGAMVFIAIVMLMFFYRYGWLI